MARLMFSAGMFSALAAAMAPRRRGLPSGSPPPCLAAMVISLIRRVMILPRLASRAPFLCLIVAHFEWPDMNYLGTDFSGLRRAQPCEFSTSEGGCACPAVPSPSPPKVCKVFETGRISGDFESSGYACSVVKYRVRCFRLPDEGEGTSEKQIPFGDDN